MVFEALGTPTPAAWPGAADLPNFLPFAPCPRRPLAATFKNVRLLLGF